MEIKCAADKANETVLNPNDNIRGNDWFCITLNKKCL